MNKDKLELFNDNVETILSKEDNEVFYDNSNYIELFNTSPGTIKTKIEKICKKAYGATEVEYSELALKQINDYTNRGYSNLPIVMCKTPASITDNPKILGAPTEHTIHIREIRLFAGAGFLVPLSGSLLMLPGHVKMPRCRDDYTLK